MLTVILGCIIIALSTMIYSIAKMFHLEIFFANLPPVPIGEIFYPKFNDFNEDMVIYIALSILFHLKFLELKVGYRLGSNFCQQTFLAIVLYIYILNTLVGCLAR